MTTETEEQKFALPDRTKPRFHIQQTEELETDLQSEDRIDQNVRVTDISASGAKISIDSQLQPSERINLRLKHQEFGLEFTLAATVRWCQLKRDSWEAGVEFNDTVIADDILDELAMDGVVERRRAERHPVDLEASLKTPGDPNNTGVIVSDVSIDGACIFTPRPVEIGERMLLTLMSQESDPVSFVAVSRWQKQQGAGFQVGCQLQSGQSTSILDACGVGQVVEQPTTFKRIRTSWVTWAVILVCAACTFVYAYPNLGRPFPELKISEGIQSLRELWPW